ENIGAANAPSGNGRIAQPLSLKPFRCYRLSFWAKTRGFETPGDFTVRLLLPGNKRSLTHLNLGLQADQDWKQHQVVFNSLDRPDVRLYLGVWGGRGGALWLDDLRLEEVGLVNLVRREGCPLEVRGADGTLYEEGKDFQPVQDPKLGTVPWRGDYSLYHEAPKIELTPGSRIREGETLRVSFYHAAFVYDMQATCCLTHPKVYSLLRDQMERVEKLFHPTTVFMQHDEIRVANWCGLCRAQHKTPGQLLAENVRRCRQIVREVSPRARVYVWSDMFDPNHNARDDYFLVNGSWAGSWEGLQPETGIVNWYYDARSKNLPFFADRGHEQILAGYYDNGVDYTVRWLNDARGIKGVTGVMYTTWANRYADLEKFAQAVWGGAEGKPGGKPEASAGSSAQAPARNR
ncbi:MAG TPA: hypothetical protein VFU47_00440, partial [Armatimonadota bacterium]|nr:hypothetical protein [Armatimonadota bacterium]